MPLDRKLEVFGNCSESWHDNKIDRLLLRKRIAHVLGLANNIAKMLFNTLNALQLTSSPSVRCKKQIAGL